MSKHVERLKRLHHQLSQSKNGKSRKELITYVFEAPNELNPKEKNAFCKAKRTEFFKLLKALREGNYEINKKTSTSKNNPCTILYDPENDRYSYALESKKPKFNNLEEDELMTLPLLLGVLLNYQHVDIFNKFYLDLIDKYQIIDEDTYVSNNIAITRGLKNFAEGNTMENVVTLYKSINENKKVAFSYAPVSLFNKEKQENVYPIQILFHEGLFYLWAINNMNDMNILNFRIDRIKGAIQQAETDDTFNSHAVKENLELNKKLQYIIGVVPPDSEKKPIKFKLKFKGWAAAYVISAPIHETWELIQTNDDNSIIGTIEVYDNFELDFLLGRFREFCEIIEPKNHTKKPL